MASSPGGDRGVVRRGKTAAPPFLTDCVSRNAATHSYCHGLFVLRALFSDVKETKSCCAAHCPQYGNGGSNHPQKAGFRLIVPKENKEAAVKARPEVRMDRTSLGRVLVVAGYSYKWIDGQQ